MDKQKHPNAIRQPEYRRSVAMHLQALEGNPLNAEQSSMFDMFEREGWSHERRLAYIRERAQNVSLVPANE